jgi:Ca2+-binding EF-hand superfamily protein
MDYDKNGRWDLRDFVAFSEKLYILYEVNQVELDVFQFMKKSRNVFNRLLSEITKELRYIRKEDWIKFLHKTEEYAGKRYFNLLIYSISRELFEVSDQNKDGYLSELELFEIYDILGIEKDTARDAMKFLDLDNDHRISKAELHEGLYDFFTNPEEAFTLFGDMRVLDHQIS